VHRNLLFVTTLFAGALAGCAGATPSGFSKGDHWSVPLVGPLENGNLLVPVSVAGQGPYLFYLDPDAPVSAIDQQVIDEAKLELTQGPTIKDETNTALGRGFASLHDLKVGDLAIESRTVIAVPKDFFNLDARRVHGMLGRDVIADRLVFGFDRDQGIVTLSVPTVFTPPAGAASITYARTEVDTGSETAGGGNGPMMTSGDGNARNEQAGRINHDQGPSVDTKTVQRRVVSAQIGGGQFQMHLDLGAPVSELRQESWAKAGLTAAPVEGGPLRLVDEAGTVRAVDAAAQADVTAGTLRGHARFVPYVEKRFGPKKVDGALGLDFFRNYAVYANWGATTYFVKPRGDAAATLTARLGRWGADVSGCAHPGCAEVKLTQTDGGLKLDVIRDPQAKGKAIELLLAPTPPAGKPAPANLLVELPPTIDTISGGMPSEYDGSTAMTVVDASPFTRPCEGNSGCVYPVPQH
jgi:hypothetical protein